MKHHDVRRHAYQPSSGDSGGEAIRVGDCEPVGNGDDVVIKVGCRTASQKHLRLDSARSGWPAVVNETAGDFVGECLGSIERDILLTS